MRLIGHLSEEAAARRFCDFLYSEGIEIQIELGSAGNWEVWVLDDDDIDRAGQDLIRFAEHPNDPFFVQAARAGAKQQIRDSKSQSRRRYRVMDGRQSFYRAPAALGMVTLTLMAVSISLAVITRVGEDRRLVDRLMITSVEQQGQYLIWDRSLPEVRQGQVWRLVTPIFLHFGYLHIIFNMLWLRDLGSVLESKRGSGWFILLVFVLAMTSNMIQFLWSGPHFGGMSGVVYGLLGYIWMQGKLHPGSGLILRPQIVTMMLIWLALGFTGMMGMANGAHLGGLLVGMGCGAAGALWTRWRR